MRSDRRPAPKSGPKPSGHAKSGPRPHGGRPKDARQDGRPGGRRPEGRKPDRRADAEADEVWLWGTHAVKAALANPERRIFEILVTRNAVREIEDDKRIRMVEPHEIEDALPRGAVHQGLAARAAPLEPVPLAKLLTPNKGLLLLLDSVTDPQNVGAVLRSAAAFGARGVILQDRKAPPFSGGCAKAAVGAAERMPHARVVNLSRALEEAREAGWRSIGLAGQAETTIEDALSSAGPAVILALGSEDKGLRPSVAEACDALARIPISDAVESLNVSNAAALALYAARAKLDGRT
jgi:23S rRNA (guanosine2251-2'-O)-methyltransferase